MYGDTIRSNLLQCTLQRLRVLELQVIQSRTRWMCCCSILPMSLLLRKRPSYRCILSMVPSRTIESAYAGGEKGREVIDALLPNVHVRKKGVCDVVHSEREWSVLFAVGTRQHPRGGFVNLKSNWVGRRGCTWTVVRV